MDLTLANNTQVLREILLNEKRFNTNYEVIEAFSKTLEKGLTRDTYIRGAKKFIEWCEENKIIEVTEEDIVAYKDYLKENYKASSVNSYITSLKKLYEFLSKKGIKNLTSDLHGTKNSKGFKRDALTIDQAKDILKNIDRSTKEGIRNYALMQLFLTTGLRTIEVERANLEDIHNTGNCTYLKVMGKGHDEKDEVVKLTYETLKAINEYLALRDIKSDKEPLFTSFSNRTNGARLKTRSIRDIIKKTFRKVGLNSDKLTTHSLRHSAITFALIGGATIQEAQQLARHSNINTTMIYAHNLERENNKAEEIIQTLINS